MAGKRRQKVRERDLTGLKYFDRLVPLLERLHEVGCERDKAGNRKLHFDQYCLMILLFLFNPIVSSLRALQQASELQKVQRKLGCERSSLGSLSEAKEVFDPERLKQIVAELGEQLEPIARDPRLKDLKHVVTLVDGTLLRGLPVLAQAMSADSRAAKVRGKARLHTQFELERYIPVRIDVTDGVGEGESDERAVLARALEKGRCYVTDRGYAKFVLFNQITAAGSSYVCRLRDNSRYEVLEERPLTPQDTAEGVILDATVRLGDTSKAEARPDHPIRLVVAVPYYAWDHREPGEMAVWVWQDGRARQPDVDDATWEGRLYRPLDPATLGDSIPPTLMELSVPSASHCYGNDVLSALNDGIEPKDSCDHDIPRFTWWDSMGSRVERVRFGWERGKIAGP
jgi:hypothetical protein